ncbi:MAG TPA: PocR ligand-binding domain-containing protein [Rhodocyclaceae bacterium]|nr:PocR ligand-binding domain-containing protein [Rhodocyclaceae bacterium]
MSDDPRSGTGAKLRFADLVDLDQFRAMMAAFYHATGIPHGLIDRDNNILSGIGWQDICVRFHRADPQSLARCRESDLHIAEHLSEAPFVGYRCLNGLMDYAAPIVVEGQHLATMFVGQFFHEPPDPEDFRRQARQFGFDEEAYLEALARVPIIPRQRIESIMAFYVQLARMLAASGLDRRRQREAERELEDFSYSMSHDLRSPLRAIVGFCQILEQDYAGSLDEEGRRLLGVVRDSGVRMGRLIDGILAFLHLNRQALHPAALDLEAMARQVFAEVAPRGRQVDFAVEPLPPARGDPDLLRQVLAHVLSNAVRFTSRKDRAVIRVGGSAGAEEQTYFVRDNGVGFDMRYADKLFRVFERLHGDAELEGPGIGLAAVRRIIHRHGGRVWAEGQPGEGAAVYFTLPTSEETGS